MEPKKNIVLVHGAWADGSCWSKEFMAKRMGTTVKSIAASHASMVSHPKEVVDIILLAAEAEQIA